MRKYNVECWDNKDGYGIALHSWCLQTHRRSRHFKEQFEMQYGRGGGESDFCAGRESSKKAARRVSENPEEVNGEEFLRYSRQ